MLDDQVSVELAPLATVVGLAASVTVGAPAPTVTTVLCTAVPPAPEQLRVNVDVALSAPVDWLPLVALLPLQPPDAIHVVALAELQVSVELAPLATVVGELARVAVGAGALTLTVVDCVLEPPAPAQVSV